MQAQDLARELDAHREPLRRLAAALLGNAQGAEDLVQEAFVAALTRGERPTGLASWLRAVVRRLALDARRRAGRRRVRESVVARPDRADDTDSLERLELVEQLAREVRELDEPFRTALRLRYFDGLAPREIAARLNVPLATVESRLVRALERLRERLDRRGGRERWLAATAAWIRPTQVPWTELLLMKAATKVAAAAAVVVLLAWATWAYWPRADPAPEFRGEAAALPAAAPEPSVSPPVTGAGRSALDVLDTTPTSPAAPAATRLAGMVIDERGAALPGVEIGALFDGEKSVRASPRVTSDAQGRFELDEPEGAGSLRAVGEQWFTLGAPPFGPRALPCDRVLCVVPRAALEGVVVDREGLPVEGVRVEITMYSGTLQAPGAGQDLLSFSRATVSARDGSYRIADAPVSDLPTVSARRPGSSVEYYRQLGELRAAQGRIVFDHGSDCVLVLHGQVVDERGTGIPGAWIDAGPKDHGVISPRGGYVRLRSGARGEFELQIRKEQAELVLGVGAHGRRFVSVEPSGDPRLESSWPTPLIVHLDLPALTLRGRVVDERGQPLPDAWVDLLDGTPWGFTRRVDEALEPLANFTWETLASGRDWTDHVPVDAQGRFELGELVARDYSLVVFDARSLHWTRAEPMRAGSSEIELVIDTSARRERVAGHVVDSDGAGVPGARVTLGATIPQQIDAEGKLQRGTGSSLEVVCDAEGRFEFLGV